MSLFPRACYNIYILDFGILYSSFLYIFVYNIILRTLAFALTNGDVDDATSHELHPISNERSLCSSTRLRVSNDKANQRAIHSHCSFIVPIYVASSLRTLLRPPSPSTIPVRVPLGMSSRISVICTIYINALVIGFPRVLSNSRRFVTKSGVISAVNSIEIIMYRVMNLT